MEVDGGAALDCGGASQRWMVQVDGKGELDFKVEWWMVNAEGEGGGPSWALAFGTASGTKNVKPDGIALWMTTQRPSGGNAGARRWRSHRPDPSLSPPALVALGIHRASGAEGGGLYPTEGGDVRVGEGRCELEAEGGDCRGPEEDRTAAEAHHAAERQAARQTEFPTRVSEARSSELP